MKTIFFLILLHFVLNANAQVIDSTKRFIPVDSLAKKSAPLSNLSKVDSVLKYHSPKKAAIRSAIVPGLGQIYNKKYWKLPIVYGALGTTAAVFFFNLSTYKELRFAYKARIEVQAVNFPYATPDSSDFKKLKPELARADLNSLRTARNEYRKNIDYSVLVFILFWGLNVADAAVDAHLKTFDVSPDLTFHFNFGHSQMAGTTGVSLVLAFK